VALSLVAVVLAACGPGMRPIDPSFTAGILTPDGNDTYALTVTGDIVKITAPTTNTGGGTRAAFWRTADPSSANHESCGTWISYGSKGRQQGAVLRARSANGRTTAITVTNNVTFGARWGFNIHVMDSGAADPYHKIGGFLLEEVFRPNGPGTTAVPPHPWRMCARVVGSVVSFIVWPLTHPEPAWDDPRYGGSVTLPSGWGASGKPGWYIGHLDPGDAAGFTDLVTSTIATTSAQAPAPVAGDAGAESMTSGAAPEPTVPPRAPTWIAEAP
jgi:hypothetical protein